MKQLTLTALTAVLATLAFAPAQAKSAFVPVPPIPGETAQPLALRVIGYDGSTNGEISVEVKNTGATPQTFAAQGLFFVPQLPANQAPQRLGAVGPMQVEQGPGTFAREERLLLAPGQKALVKLDVFCIDSHRGSPTSSTPFRLAKRRLPKELTASIDSDARQAADSAGGFAAPAAKSSVQGEVWKNRDKKWIAVEGEGVQEIGK